MILIGWKFNFFLAFGKNFLHSNKKLIQEGCITWFKTDRFHFNKGMNILNDELFSLIPHFRLIFVCLNFLFQAHYFILHLNVVFVQLLHFVGVLKTVVHILVFTFPYAFERFGVICLPKTGVYLVLAPWVSWNVVKVGVRSHKVCDYLIEFLSILVEVAKLVFS